MEKIPAAPIPGERLRSGEEKFGFVSPCSERRCTWTPGADKGCSPHVFREREERPKILPHVLHAVGHTPLVRLNKIPASYGIKCEMLAKCEFFNPTGSIKDRIAVDMVRDAERRGLLRPGDVIVEPTAGNTGLGLAMAAAVGGYECKCVMPLRMSNDKADAVRALGGSVVRTPKAELGSRDCVFNVAQRICRETPRAIVLDQFRNACNPLVHYETTAEEILAQCDGKVDAVVCGSGTGGTMTGIGRKMREKCPSCRMIGADPVGSCLAQPDELNETDVVAFEMEGIGFPFVPTTLDRSVVAKWYKVTDKESMLMARRMVTEEGILCGGSSGTAVCAAIEAAKTMSEGERLVVILPDGVRNYMTKFVSDPWMKIRDYIGIDDEKRWWWSFLPAKRLPLKRPDAIPGSASCGAAVRHMSLGNRSHAFVENDGAIVGWVTSDKMLSDLMEMKYTFEHPVERVVNPVRVVPEDTPLGKICAIIQVETFVLVESGNPEGGTGVKYASSRDLLEFVGCDGREP